MVTGSADETGGGARRAPGFGSASRNHKINKDDKKLQKSCFKVVKSLKKAPGARTRAHIYLVPLRDGRCGL